MSLREALGLKETRRSRERKEEQEKKEKMKEELRRLSKKSSDFVLTISASEYIACGNPDISGTSLEDYEFKLVKGLCHYRQLDNKSLWVSAVENLVENGEKVGAEIIVGIRPSSNWGRYEILYGTALVPKSTGGRK